MTIPEEIATMKKPSRTVPVAIAAAAVLLVIGLLVLHQSHRIKGPASGRGDVDVSGPAYPSLPLEPYPSRVFRGDWDEIMERRHIRVLTTMSRTNFYISDGRLAGYEYEKLKEFQRHINRDIPRQELQVVLEFIPVKRNELLPMLISGRGDIAAAMLTVTPARQKRVAFTTPYLTDIREVVVTYGNEFTPRDVTDLSGRSVFVRASSSYHESLQELNARLQSQSRAPARIVRADEDLETESILEMLNTGAVGITVSNSHVAELWSRLLPNIVVHDHVVLRSGVHIAWAVRKENPLLRERLNEFLESHKRGTLLGNIYFQRYFQSISRLKNPTDAASRDRMMLYKDLIQHYAGTYGFDWLLIMALAFQESGLDHSRVSDAGAVGLMQVLPSTAEDPRIGIDDVNDLENNIHAGIKYLAWLRDTFFLDPGIDPPDRIRLALAAYNAGPATINRARELAGEMGLDPNTWFRNVELAALRIVGQETVNFVANINKHYLAYQMLVLMPGEETETTPRDPTF